MNVLKKLFFLSFFFFLLLSCTNWKSKYLVTKGDLDKCLSEEPKQEIIIQDRVVSDHQAVKSDTIYIDDKIKIINGRKKTTNEKNQMINDFSQADDLYYEKEYALSLNMDSVNVWLTIKNRLIGQAFIQTVGIDSVSYPQTRIIKEYNKTKTIRDVNIWKYIVIGFIGGLIVFGIFAFFWTKYKK